MRQQANSAHSVVSKVCSNVCNVMKSMGVDMVQHLPPNMNRDYHCSRCPVSLKLPSDTWIHAMQHVANKMFTCLKCGEHLCDKTSLDEHTRRHQMDKTSSLPMPDNTGVSPNGVSGDVEIKEEPTNFINAFLHDFPGADCSNSKGLSPDLDSFQNTVTHFDVSSDAFWLNNGVDDGIHQEETLSPQISTNVPISNMEEKKQPLQNTRRKKYGCQVCNKEFYRPTTLQLHMRMHEKSESTLILTCSICSESLNSPWLLIQHMIANHKESCRPYTCKICHVKLKTDKGFIHHLDRHQPNDQGRPRYRKTSEIFDDTKEGDILPVCKLCSENYRPIKYSGKTSRVCYHNCDPESSVPHRSDFHYYGCRICGKTFVKKEYANRHALGHDGPRPTKCPICDKVYASPEGVQGHIKGVHGVKKYLCEVCSRSFSRGHDFRAHVMRHRNEYPFSCDVCHRRFSQMNSMKAHRQIHREDRPFMCHLCPKSFHVKVNLKNHMAVHSTDRKYRCDLCSKTYKMRKHLVAHKKFHSGLKPHVCPVCERTFVLRGTLTVHMKSHN